MQPDINYRHLDEQVMEEIRPNVWIPAIPLPLYTHKLLFKHSYQCGCGEVFSSTGDYQAHYRAEQMLEMNRAMSRSRDISKAKALFWRRYAYVLEFGNEDERDDLCELDKPEMLTLPELDRLNSDLEEIWGRAYMRIKKKSNDSVGRIHDETEITDEDPAEAAKDVDVYSHTNSHGVTYFLHMKMVQLRGGKEHPIYFFARDIRPQHAVKELPKDLSVNENPRNGFLTVRRGE